MVVMVWSGCCRHGVVRISLSGPGTDLVGLVVDLVDHKGSGRLWLVQGGS